jgi:hypothetical protein
MLFERRGAARRGAARRGAARRGAVKHIKQGTCSAASASA